MKYGKIILAVFLIYGLYSCSSSTESETKPNILLILADDLGWSDIGCYGSEVQTPNLDQLAEQGMRFTQFHNTSKCFPSRACLITGVYAQQNAYDRTFTNPISYAVTFGEVLRDAGYRTMWSGKHHGLENPVYRGFDRYYGLKDGACNYFNPGNQRPGEGVPARKGDGGNKGDAGEKRKRAWCIDSVMYTPYTPEVEDFYTTDYFTNAAVDWLEEYRDEEKPFFLFMAYTAPHDPLMAWPEDIEKYKGKYDDGYAKIRLERFRKQKEIGLIDANYLLSEATHASWESLSDEKRIEEIQKMEVYAAMIDRLDQNIGRLLNKLKETGRFENTIILFMSDNGASAEMVRLPDDFGEIGSMTLWSSLGEDWANVGNTPLRYFKNFSYQGGINTPLIAYWPGVIEEGSFSAYPGHFIDIMSTFVEISGSDYPEEYNGQPITPMQGESLLPVFRGETETREGPLFWEWKKGKAARSGNWKIVKDGPDNPWDLYDLTDDPSETNNLAEMHPEKVLELEKQFLDWKALVSKRPDGTIADDSEEYNIH